MTQALKSVERVYSSVEVCFRRAQSLALLDALICPEWEYRYYSMDVAWSAGEQLASVRNSEGDHAFLLFSGQRCCFKEIDHEQFSDAAAFTEVVRGHLPAPLGLVQQVLDEPAFYASECTALGWYEAEGSRWQEVVPSDAGHLRLSRLILSGTAEEYQVWAEEYYEQEIPIQAVQRVFNHEPLSTSLVSSLNPTLTLKEVSEDASGIGYPIAELPH